MRFLLPISISLLLAGQAVRAQTAEDFFNGGAQLYISNNVPSALEKVEGGLKMYPGDEKLKKLEELLKQQSQQNQQQQDQKNQNQSQQQQKDQQSQQQKSDDQKNQQQQPQSSQKDSQDQKKPDEQKQDQSGQKKDDQQKQPEQQKSSADKKDGEKPATPGQMTPEEAKRLLDARKGDEQVLKLQPKGKPQDPKRLVKDW
jgi:Ca-activated chloride channel family protein